MKSIYPLLMALALASPLTSHAETDVRVFGGISISSGNLRIYITGDQPLRYYHKPRPRHHYYSHPGHRKGWYKHHGNYSRHSHYPRKDYGYRYYYPVQQRIIIRDPGLHDYRRYRHQRSYHYR